MKVKILSTTLTTLVISLGTTFFFTQPSYGGDTTFNCESGVDFQGRPIEILVISPPHTPNISLMQFSNPQFSQWKNQQGQNYDPAVRCEAVKTKFQLYFDCTGNDNPLNSTSLAGATFPWKERQSQRIYYPVIVTTLNPDTKSRECLRETADTNPTIKGLIFMLPPDPDINRAAAIAQDALNKLFDIRFYTVGDPIQN